MQLIRTTAPASLAEMILQDVCDHIRVVADLAGSPAVEPADLDHISALATAAVDALDGAAGRLKRALLTQEWRWSLDYFPDVLMIPLPPCQSVDAVKYVDVNGVTQTLAAENYTVTGIGASAGARVTPVECWPAIKCVPGAVTVEFTAGYGGTAADVPSPIVQAVKDIVAQAYMDRSAVDGLTAGVRALLAPYRVFR